MFQATGDSFYLEIVSPDWAFTKIFCIWKRLFLKELFLEEAQFNAYI